MTLRIATAATAIFSLAVVMSSVTAHAVSSPVPLSVQIGVGSQLSSSARNQVGGTSFHAGASLDLSNGSTLFVLPGTQGIDADYNYTSGHGGHSSAYGVSYTNRIDLIPKIAQPLTSHIVPYLGFGIGIFEADVKTSSTITTSNPEGGFRSAATTTVSHSGSKTNLGGKLIAGVGLPKSAFFEVSYIISGSAIGVRTDSLNFAIGTHF